MDASQPLDAELPDSTDSAEREQGLAIQWERARNPVFAQILAQVGSLHDAEDVFQEVAVCLAKDYHKYDPQRPFISWALGIARNQALMFLRKRNRDRLAFGEDLLRIVQSHLSESPVKEMEARSQALHECLRKLPESRRLLLGMRYSGNLKLTEISQRSGKTVTAIKGQLYRIRKLLADCIEHRLSAS